MNFPPFSIPYETAPKENLAYLLCELCHVIMCSYFILLVGKSGRGGGMGE